MPLLLLLVLIGITVRITVYFAPPTSTFQTQDTEKMISIFGTPVSYTTSTTMNFNFSDCMDYCLEMPACMVVQDNGNGTYESDRQWYLSRRSVGEFGYATVVGPYNTTYSNGIWKFTTLACPTNFTLVERPLGQWCIGVIPASNAITQTYASTACSALYGGVLSGLQSLDEYNLVIGEQEVLEIFRKKVLEMAQPVLAGFSATIRSYAALGFWIDGSRKAVCKSTVTSASCNGTNEFTFFDPTLSAYDGYVWGPRQPSGISSDNSNCIQFPFLTANGTSTGVDDYTCSSTISDTLTTAFVGYICGVRPSVQ
ncbi:Protein CBR-CLEC-112 [Caenorhabditis briggsae]|uniref:Protein CBR-CLEC-112 n=1 Tax=Caenorhabditis briggsae TaxID=6238 RepID=A8WK50_CAEBR|nr:Protein CBR-CLEC-112 [Caenorhabditis briggsae]CAP20843.2 Protein CBR-CLEC-112 [Caenorhabditis briggsae]